MVKVGAFGEFENGGGADIEWLKLEDGKPQELVILSHISNKNAKEDFVLGRDLLAYRAWKPYTPSGFKNAEGESVFITLPVIDADEHNDEESENPYVNIMELLGVTEQVKANYLMWVMNADTKKVLLYNPPVSVAYQLLQKEELAFKKRKTLRGSVVSIGRTGKGLNTKYDITPMWDTVDVSGVEIPCDLRETPSVKSLDTVDKQIVLLNSIKESLMKFLKMEKLEDDKVVLDESRWPFTEENKVKEEFLTALVTE